MRIYRVDTFSSEPFRGNPAVVCALKTAAPEEWMRQIAAEVNVSETAFTHPLPEGGLRLRWFTPAVEMNLCGHGMLAAAHVIATAEDYPGRGDRPKPGSRLPFLTNSGELSAVVDGSGIALDFPAIPVTECDIPGEVPQALDGAKVKWSGTSRFNLVLELDDAATVAAVKPDFAALAALPYRAVIVTAAAPPEGEADFVSRFFAPRRGLAEDPVTGASHCVLGPLWAERLGRDRLLGHQVSQRGGRVGVILRGDRVELRGTAVTVMTGEIALAAMPSV